MNILVETIRLTRVRMNIQQIKCWNTSKRIAAENRMVLVVQNPDGEQQRREGGGPPVPEVIQGNGNGGAELVQLRVMKVDAIESKHYPNFNKIFFSG